MNFPFPIHTKPKPKGRPRLGKTRAGHPVAYTDSSTRQFEALVADTAAQHITSPLEGPLLLDVLIVLPRPKRLMRKKDPEGFVWADKRPDTDNILKALTDGMHTCYRDDAQIVQVFAAKVYAEKTGKPRIVVHLAQLTNPPQPPIWFYEQTTTHNTETQRT